MERGRPVPGLGLGRAGVAASALFAVLLGGCDSGEVDGTPSATATALPPTVEATEAAIGATDTPSPPATPPAEPDVYAHLPAANGVLSLDPITGEVTEVWAGPERIWLPGIYARLSGRGDGVWLSWDGSEESVRYDLEGNEVDRVPGLFATESPNGTVVVYLDQPYGPEASLVVRDERYETVDLQISGGSAVPHDDGRVAFLGLNDVGNTTLYLYEPRTRQTKPLALTERPGKEGVLYPVWSPSGRFVTDWSSGVLPDDPGHGILVDTFTGEVTESPEPYVWVRGPNGEDWYARAVDGAVVLIDAATDTEVHGMVSDAGPLLPSSDLGGAILARIGTRHPSGQVELTGAMVFDLNGNELGRWEGRNWYPTLTREGPAAHFVDAASQSDCPPGRVEHPDLEIDLDCIGTEQAWSPDGRFLAMKVDTVERSNLLVLDTQSGDTLIVDVGRGFGFEWNRDSTRIMLRIGGGL